MEHGHHGNQPYQDLLMSFAFAFALPAWRSINGAGAPTSFLLMETGDFLLQEDGFYIGLEF